MIFFKLFLLFLFFPFNIENKLSKNIAARKKSREGEKVLSFENYAVFANLQSIKRTQYVMSKSDFVERNNNE
jgi:hypothetical protein